MPYEQGGIITANSVPDYNSLKDLVNSVYADSYSGVTSEATANYGYGKTPIAAVAAGETITAAQWNTLFAAINACLTHQGTSTAIPASVSVGQVISAYASATGLVNSVGSIVTNRLTVASGQYTTTTGGTKLSSIRSTAWNPQIIHEFTVNFGSYNGARYFFNAGGAINLAASRVGGTADAINTAWATLLNNIGTISFASSATTKTGSAGTASTFGFYDLTTAYQPVFTASVAGYASDTYVLQARSTATFGTTGTISFRIIMSNTATIDGTVTSFIDEKRSTGAIEIPSPTFATVTGLADGGAVSAIVATNDSGSIDQNGGVVVANVRANDTINGATATGANSTITQLTADAGLTLNTTTGAVSLASGGATGTKTLTYRLAESANPANTDDATVTVTVTSSSATLVVTNDSGTISDGSVGGTAVANVRANDTVNGAVATDSNSVLTQLTADTGVSLNTTTGAVTVAAGTTTGTKTLTYRLAEAGNTGNNATGTVTVTVNQLAIVATNDNFGSVPETGGIAGNVLANDTFNGAPATTSNVVISNVVVTPANAGITIAANGDLTVANGTTAQSYSVTYRISQTGYTSNFDDATATFTVADLTWTVNHGSTSASGTNYATVDLFGYTDGRVVARRTINNTVVYDQNYYTPTTAGIGTGYQIRVSGNYMKITGLGDASMAVRGTTITTSATELTQIPFDTNWLAMDDATALLDLEANSQDNPNSGVNELSVSSATLEVRRTSDNVVVFTRSLAMSALAETAG